MARVVGGDRRDSSLVYSPVHHLGHHVLQEVGVPMTSVPPQLVSTDDIMGDEYPIPVTCVE